jgi:hypothetical protein
VNNTPKPNLIAFDSIGVGLDADGVFFPVHLPMLGFGYMALMMFSASPGAVA